MAKPSYLPLMLLLVAAGLAPAAHGQPPARRPSMGTAPRIMEPEAAAERTRRMLGGRVLGVRTIREGDHVIQRVKVLLPGGRVRILSLDASTGQVLK